jgi:sigma-B regulation protein RsbU (phosphoserine phosphatase)
MNKALPKILVVEKATGYSALLAANEFEIVRVNQLANALDQLGSHSFDLILLELSLSDSQGLNTFSQVRAVTPHTPVIVMADTGEEELASRTIWMGAQDYLIASQITGAVLTSTIHKTIDRHRCQLTHNHEGFLLQVLMDNIPDAIYFKDTRSRFLMISRAMTKLFGLEDPQQAVGKTDADFFAGTHAQQALLDEQKIMRTGIPMKDVEESETWHDGHMTWASTTKMPLRNQAGRIVGTFGISRDITKRKIAELALAERTQQLQKKNEQIQEELKMARELQLAMLPQNFPTVPHNGNTHDSALKFFSFFLPSGAVSGDFFDVIPLTDDSVGVFICDVMGHDVRAALVTAMLRALVEDYSAKTKAPGDLLAAINRELFGVFQQTGTTMYATAFYLIADVASGKVSFASAAHPNPLQLKRCQNKVEVLSPQGNGKKGPALGLFKEGVFPTYERQMDADDVIILYTDGMTEAEGIGEEIFSLERLTESIQKYSTLPTNEMLAETLGEIRRFSGQQEFEDDVCLIGVEVKKLKSN